MRIRMIRTIAVAAAALLLAGCGARSQSVAASNAAPQFDKMADSRAAESAAPAAPAAQSAAFGDISLPAARMVIKTAALSVRVRDVDAAFGRSIQLAEERGGYVQSSTRSAEAGDRADLTIRVPPAGFLPLIGSIESLGTPESKSIEGQDVTEEYYDLAAELENQVEVRGRLFQLLKQAKKVDEAIQVEQQLERIGANVNRIKGRMKFMETMVGMSTISVSLYTEERAAAESFVNWSLIGNGFVVAARFLVQALFFILQALVVLIPLGALGGAAAWGVIRILRARRGAPITRPPITRPRGRQQR